MISTSKNLGVHQLLLIEAANLKAFLIRAFKNFKACLLPDQLGQIRLRKIFVQVPQEFGIENSFQDGGPFLAHFTQQCRKTNDALVVKFPLYTLFHLTLFIRPVACLDSC